MPAKKLGFNACVCRNGSAFGTPAHIPLLRIKDIKENLAPGANVDSSSRLVNAYSTIPTMYKISYDFDGLWDGGAGLTALRTAFLAGGTNNDTTSKIELAILDAQPTLAGTGYRGDWAVPKFSLDFPLLGEQKVSLSIKPYGNYATGQYVATYTDATVSAGTPETAGTIKLGKNASVNTSGGTPITSIRDWKLNLEWTEVDSADRATPYESILMTQIKVSAELNFLWDTSDANLVAFKTAFQATQAGSSGDIDLYLLDGPYTSGSWGVFASWAVTDMTKDNPLSGGQPVTVKLEPYGNPNTLFQFVTI